MYFFLAKVSFNSFSEMGNGSRIHKKSFLSCNEFLMEMIK